MADKKAMKDYKNVYTRFKEVQEERGTAKIIIIVIPQQMASM